MINRKNKDEKPYLIAITGNFGTGKSTVGEILEENGQVVLDTDKIVNEILQNKNNVTEKIVVIFGKEIINNDSNYFINKKKLASVIFTDKEKKKQLENIVHPAVEQILEQLFKSNNDKEIIFVLVPLLFECSLEKNYHLVWCVKCEKNIQHERLLSKGFSEEEINNRIAMQMDQANKEVLSDIIIDNSFSKDNTKEQVSYELSQILAQIRTGSIKP